jgi:hypothetical protein
MQPEDQVKRGRPARDPIEVARTITWYLAVRKASLLSESKLEIRYDKLNRSERGLHRGSRWNKYKAGISNPSEELVTLVNYSYNETFDIYHHPVWKLSSKSPASLSILREAVYELPAKYSKLLAINQLPEASDFWLLEDINFQYVLSEIAASTNQVFAISQESASPAKRKRPPRKPAEAQITKDIAGWLDKLACVLILIEIARLRQLEDWHFQCHEHLAKTLVEGCPLKEESSIFARTEAVVLDKWLATDYSNMKYRAFAERLRTLGAGPVPPWMPIQSSLKLSKALSKKVQMDHQSTRGYWVLHYLLNSKDLFGIASRDC